MKSLLFSLAALMLGASSVATQAAPVVPESRNGGGNIGGMALRHKSTGYDRLTMNMPAAPTRADEVGIPITEAPAGVEKLYSRGGYALYPNMWDIVYEERTEDPGKIIEGDDDYVYIFNPILSYPTDSYMKCERRGDKLVATLPQPIYNLEFMGTIVRSFHIAVFELDEDVNGDEDWVNQYIENPDITEVTFTVAEDGTISLDWEYEPTYDEEGNLELPKKIFSMGDENWSWCQYGDRTQTYIPFNEKLITLPDNAEVEKWTFISEEWGEIVVKSVNVAIVDNDFYLSGLDESLLPGAWIKGSIKEDTIIFESGQYLGYDYHYFYFLFGASRESEYGPIGLDKELVCKYDMANQIITSNPSEGLLINCSKESLLWMDFFENPTIKKPNANINPIPATPIINGFEEYEEWGYSYFDFVLPNYSVDYDILDTDNMWYEVLLDGDPMIFDPEDYFALTEEMVEIPYNFNCSYQISASGIYHYMYLYISGFDKIGLCLYNAYEGKTYASDIVEYDLATGDVTTDLEQLTWQEVDGVEYYDLSGMRVMNPNNGIFVRRTHLSNGKVLTQKVKMP